MDGLIMENHGKSIYQWMIWGCGPMTQETSIFLPKNDGDLGQHEKFTG
jgi:hypothetical protein